MPRQSPSEVLHLPHTNLQTESTEGLVLLKRVRLRQTRPRHITRWGVVARRSPRIISLRGDITNRVGNSGQLDGASQKHSPTKDSPMLFLFGAIRAFEGRFRDTFSDKIGPISGMGVENGNRSRYLEPGSTLRAYPELRTQKRDTTECV